MSLIHTRCEHSLNQTIDTLIIAYFVLCTGTEIWNVDDPRHKVKIFRWGPQNLRLSRHFFFSLDFLYVVRTGKTKVLPTTPFDFVFFFLQLWPRPIFVFSWNMPINSLRKTRWCSGQSLRKTKMKQHVSSFQLAQNSKKRTETLPDQLKNRCWCSVCCLLFFSSPACTNTGTDTSRLKHKTPNFVSRECRMQYQLECHIFGIMLTIHYKLP